MAQSQSQPNGTHYLDHERDNQLVQRVLSYSLVNYVSGTIKSSYSYVRDSNYIVKAGFLAAENTAQPFIHKLEEYSHQPKIESLLHKVDQYGCRQLDKIESGGKQIKETYDAIKPKTIQSLENVANKIHGTTAETVLFKTVGVVDAVVDSLLPADPAAEPEDDTQVAADDPNIIDKTTPVVNKLKHRVNKDSIIHLPYQTYTVSKDIIFRNVDAVPQLHYCVGMLSTAAHRVRDASASTQAVARNGIQKGADLSKASVDYVYQSLHHMVNQLTSLVVLVKKLDPLEAKATLEELLVMIQNSKDTLSQKYGEDTAHRLKEDISKILQRAGDLLSQQVAAGYTRVHSSDNAAIRKSVEKIESIVVRIIDSFSPSTNQQNGQQSQNQPKQKQQSQ